MKLLIITLVLILLSSCKEEYDCKEMNDTTKDLFIQCIENRFNDTCPSSHLSECVKSFCRRLK